MMDAATKGRKRIGTIRWAVALAIIITISAVISYLLTSGIRYVYFGGEYDNFWIWSTAIYQIMGSITGAVLTIIALILYHRGSHSGGWSISRGTPECFNLEAS